jgi:hypothetical protein
MKNSFERFAIRFPAAAALGLALIALRGWSPAQIVTPLYASPWEMGKLVYWPMLISLTLLAGLTGGIRKTLLRAAPCLTLTPLALFLTCWAVSQLRPSGGIYLLIWVALTAVGLALCERETGKGRGVFVVLAAALGVLYILFTFLPPPLAPFLDPADVTAMAVIPV